MARFGLENAKPYSTPVDINVVLSKEQCPTTVDEVKCISSIPYLQLLGCLMHSMVAVRLDIGFAVGLCARFMNNPGKVHWIALKRIARFINGTLDRGILFQRTGGVMLEGYSDSDYAMDVDDRKSTGGYVYSVAKGAVSWRSKKQPTIAKSTAEAEFIAMDAAASEAKMLRMLLSDVGFEQTGPTPLYCDNQSAIALAQNGKHREATKHIDIKVLSIREQIKLNELKLLYVPTKEQRADFLTKGLAKLQFSELCRKVGLVDPGLVV